MQILMLGYKLMRQGKRKKAKGCYIVWLDSEFAFRKLKPPKFIYERFLNDLMNADTKHTLKTAVMQIQDYFIEERGQL